MKILQKENKILHQIAKPVQIEKIKTPEIKKVIRDMQQAMSGEEDAVAIAAPQIGVLLRMFVVSGKALLERKGKKEKAKVGPLPEGKGPTFADLIFINPKIIKKSKKETWVEEGVY